MGESWMKRKIWITVISAACCSRCRVVFNAEICLTTYTPCDCTSFVTLWVNKFLTKALCVSFLTWIVCQDNPILVERDEIVCRAFDAHLPVGLRNLSESSHRFMREHTHIVQLLTRVSPSRFVDHGVYFFMNESHVHGEYSWASFFVFCYWIVKCVVCFRVSIYLHTLARLHMGTFVCARRACIKSIISFVRGEGLSMCFCFPCNMVYASRLVVRPMLRILKYEVFGK